VAPPPAPELGWKDFLKAIGIIWAIEVVLGILTAVIMLAASGFQPQSMALRLEYVFPSLVLSWIATFAVVWYFACRKIRRPVRQALALRAVSWKTALRCAGVGVAAAFVAGILMFFFANEKGYITDLALKPPDEEGGGPVIAPLFLLVLFLVPPLEELYYRGFVYPSLRRLVGVPVAFAAVVLWFGIIHPPPLYGDWAGVAVVTGMGAVFTYLRQRYDSVLPSIAAHLAYNGTLGIAGVFFSAFE